MIKILSYGILMITAVMTTFGILITCVVIVQGVFCAGELCTFREPDEPTRVKLNSDLALWSGKIVASSLLLIWSIATNFEWILNVCNQSSELHE